MALTSTYARFKQFQLDRLDMLTRQSPSRAHTAPLKRIARGVLVALVGALCFLPEAGGSIPMQYVSYKEYSLYLLNFNYKQYDCLEKLYTKESNWNPAAVNGSHYGIPQGRSKYLARVNGYKQIQWGLDYIRSRYSEPCLAWKAFKRKGWH